MSSSLALVEEHRLVAIVRLDDLQHGVALVEALLRGGVRAIELTLTNRDALRVVDAARHRVAEFASGQATIGLGSVRKPSEANEAIAAGAQFLVSPIVHPGVIEIAKAAGVAVMPGAVTPTEMDTAWQLGADIVKVFPASSLGPSYIRDVLAPLPYLKLMPTGGVRVENMPDYFAAGAVAVGAGGSLVDPAAVVRKEWSQIEARVAKYVEAARRTR